MKSFRIRRLPRPDLAPLKVYLAAGARIRDSVEVDFTMGGNGYRYKFIPTNEVWIDENLDEHDRGATIVHEVAELRLMREGMPYGKAHDKASEVEREWRAMDLRRSGGRRGRYSSTSP